MSTTVSQKDSAAQAYREHEVPPGYAAVPLNMAQRTIPLRVCVLVRRDAEALAGHLVVLRDTPDARVLLGCIVDVGGYVHQWVEIWIQNVETQAASLLVGAAATTNRAMDERWSHSMEALAAIEPGLVFRTGWEYSHPLPTIIDLTTMEPLHPTDGITRKPWQLCKDEQILASHGLPSYLGSSHRYLHVLGRDANLPLVAATESSPSGEHAQPLAAVLSAKPNLLVLNSAGLIHVRAYCPLSYEAFIDLLSGAPASEMLHGRTPLPIAMVGSASEAAGSHGEHADNGWLFMGQHGQWGRLLESFHLRLRALADAVAAVRAWTRATKRPMLNLAAESFGINSAGIHRSAEGLPSLWTARTVLLEPGAAVEVSLADGNVKWFAVPAAARTSEFSIYRPAGLGSPLQGRGLLRLRKQTVDARGNLAAEGTFSTQERLQPGRGDLVVFRLSVGGSPLELCARLEAESALATGEWRVRTIPQQFPQQRLAQLRAAEGVPLSNTPFEYLPMFATPCDLYALGVLAVRTLLVNGERPLPVALDEALSLAHQVAKDHDGRTDLSQRIRAAFEKDDRWLSSLGPHRLTHRPIQPKQVLDIIPTQIWWDTLAMIVRMFPAIGPDSQCKDWSETSAGALHKTFEQTLLDLRSLLVRTRSLIVIDWRYNREIQSVLRGSTNASANTGATAGAGAAGGSRGPTPAGPTKSPPAPSLGAAGQAGASSTRVFADKRVVGGNARPT